MLDFFKSVPRQGSACTQFVKQASTARVYRTCRQDKHSECLDDCLAVKVVRAGMFDPIEPKIQLHVTEKVEGTEGEEHFNKLYKVLAAPHGMGKTIILKFEHPWARNVSDLSSLLTNFDMTERLWKAINFQLLSALTSAQRRVAGFTHNDCHTQNILVVRNFRDAHVCAITSPKGRRMTTFSNMLIRIIDFGQALCDDPALQTRDGKKYWSDLQGNKMIDFHRFAVWAAFDVQQAALRQKALGLRQKYPPWFTEWRRFLARWLVLEMMPDVDSGGADKEKGAWLSENGLVPNDFGGAYLQQHYSKSSPLGLADMLDDPYFDEYEIRKTTAPKPSPIEFELEAKLKQRR